MINVNFRLTYMLVLILAMSVPLKGQPEKALPAAEKVNIFTDRGLYIAGETLCFSAFVTSVYQNPMEQSLILYAEIISADGMSIARSKFPVVDYSADGCLSIPKEIITGQYFLKVYTKYMRNVGPDAYAYIGLKIINPLRNEVMKGNEPKEFSKDQLNAGNTKNPFIITIDKNEYAPRDVVNVSVKTTVAADNARMCISIVPEAAVSENMLHRPDVNYQVTTLRFYPETRGVSITGELKDEASGKAVKDARINLSIIGKGRDFMAIQTDSAGRYFFSLPAYKGFRDLFICAENTPDFRPKVSVDNDFSTEPVILPSPVFKLNQDERTAALNMAVNARIGKIFAPDTIPCDSTENRAEKAFYGTPTEILTFDNYIQLPTLEEYFNELDLAVKVRKRHGEKYFKVRGTQAEMEIFDPLIMVDWVDIADPAKILAVSPLNISRIEIVNEPYIKGDITYGGIVSIISKRSDFAGIELPASGIFINYLFLDDSQICTKNELISPNIPFARNTVYWNPKLVFNTDNNARFSFTTPDIPGRYKIVIKGINGNRETIEQTAIFEVRPGQ